MSSNDSDSPSTKHPTWGVTCLPCQGYKLDGVAPPCTSKNSTRNFTCVEAEIKLYDAIKHLEHVEKMPYNWVDHPHNMIPKAKEVMKLWQQVTSEDLKIQHEYLHNHN
ncbi:hypothetical protein J4E85_007268 [Alternaria conjuncta]|uniref:uncharacterized protein n=1 Tax=Alternaria conjuncta TaxID=181017 RepID=UPI00222122FC|nr:uncharacterized protein J4E85_007268 [Alternaria conjuncta]KAI4925389.1 hypothetical protein J4E85_007268 [Alternaria conjuncta]